MESVGRSGISGCDSFPLFHVINILVLDLNIDQISLEKNTQMLNKYSWFICLVSTQLSESIYIQRENYKQEASNRNKNFLKF